jgi:hypothetical protein
MSVEASTWAWRQPVKGNAKLVLLAIADHADPVGVCWPGQDGLAMKCGITGRSVRDQLVVLERAGLIERTPRWRDGGGRTSDLITLSMRPESPSGKAMGIPEDFVASDGAYRNEGSAINRKRASGEPSVEPSVEEEPSTPLDVQPRPESDLGILHFLRDLADTKGCKRPTYEAITKAIANFPDRDHLAVAHDLDYWARHGNGADRTRMAIANTYRNFLKRAEPKPSAGTSNNGRSQSEAWVREHLPQLSGFAFDLAASEASKARYRGDTPDPEAVRRYVEQRTDSDGSEG